MLFQLLLASENAGKLLEMKPLLSNLPVKIVTPSDLGLKLEVEEDGGSYAENAAIKAKAYCLASGLPALADDSGLEVEGLGGQPGIHSHRFCPKTGADDADRRSYLISRLSLSGKEEPWLACFRCTVAVATPQGGLFFSEGLCPGEIIKIERGSNGFGYDPIFLLKDKGLTMAELPLSEKNNLSHRSRAVEAILPVIMSLL